MLVLSRKPNEDILIGSDIVVTVVKIEPGRVRIGIKAPSDMHVLRAELLLDSENEGDDERA